jgi:hypothetical protein
MTSTERVRRWRLANPERYREQHNNWMARYRGTAKGMLERVRQNAKARGNR